MANQYVVTGGCGFIGCNIVAELNARGDDNIIVVDELGCDEKWKNLVGLRFEDVLDKSVFRRRIEEDKMSGVDAVFHLGACSSTTETDAGFLADNNYRYTRELCEWCLSRDVRFIYASSGATYGDGSLGYSDAPETTVRLQPLNMYGYSKHMFDLWALKHGLFSKIAGLKYFNVYGPHEDHKGDMRSVVHKAYGQIRETGSVKLFKSYKADYADGEQVRDFIYVKDAVAATLFFAEQTGVSGLFNCGTGKARTWLDLVGAVFSALEMEPRIQFVDMPEHLKEKYQYHTEADITNLRESGYDRPFISLEDGVFDYVKNYLNLDR